MPGAGSASGEAALGDVTMLELGTFFAAPFGGTVLREVGARVIKVEPMAGEPMRNLLPFPELGAAKCLQGKESICVDLSTDEGREIVHALAKKSDIVLQSFRAGVAKRQGVDADTLRGINPDLVYLNSPGYGIDGPCGDRPAYRADHRCRQRPRHAQHRYRDRGATGSVAEGDPGGRHTAGRCGHDRVRPGRRDLGAHGSERHDARPARYETGRAAQEMLTTMLTSTAHALADDMVEYKDRLPTQAADAELLGYSARYRLYQAADEWVYLAAPRRASGPRCAPRWKARSTWPPTRALPTRRRGVANDAALAGVLAGVFAAEAGPALGGHAAGGRRGVRGGAPRAPRDACCSQQSSRVRPTCWSRWNTRRSVNTSG